MQHPHLIRSLLNRLVEYQVIVETLDAAVTTWASAVHQSRTRIRIPGPTPISTLPVSTNLPAMKPINHRQHVLRQDPHCLCFQRLIDMLRRADPNQTQ